MVISDQTIERLSAYRRLCRRLTEEGRDAVFSHELATLEGVSPAQVRRDLMVVDCVGSPARGYGLSALVEKIGELLDPPQTQGFAIAGVGRLGKAVLAYFAGRHPHLSIVAAFDNDHEKAGTIIHGCRCYQIDQIEEIITKQNVAVGLIAVPVEAAQSIADRMVRAGVRSLVNFAPVRLRVPEDVYVEDVDLTVALEKVAYFARSRNSRKEENV